MRFWTLFILCLQLCAQTFDRVTPSSSEEIASLSSNLLIAGFISPFSGQPVLSEVDLHVKGAQDLILKRSYISPQILGRYDDKDRLDYFFTGKTLSELDTKGWIFFPHLWAGRNKHSGPVENWIDFLRFFRIFF